jgi:glycosyltransferase involved in cell wall biosynthesis
MRLLVVTQYFWPENFRINDLTAELVRRGHQVTVLTGLPNYPDGQVFSEFRKDPHSFLKYEGVEIVRVPMTARGRGSFRLMLNYFTFAVSASVLGPLKMRGRDFDAIFTCQLSPVTVGLPAAVMRFVKRVPMVFWVLDLWPNSIQAVGAVHSHFILRAIGWLVKFIYNRCDLILAQSKSFIPQIKKYTKTSKRVEYFPSWAESIFDQKSGIFANEVPVRPESFSVMFAGNIGDAQDFPAILDAVEKLRSHTNIRWLFLGDGRASPWVAEQIKQRNLQDCALMLGQHPLKRMPSFFMHADALLVSLKDDPIFSMTIPGKLQSYLASGIPVVAMLNGEGADVVKKSKSGLTCNAGDSAGLAAAVLRLSEMTKDQRIGMGKNGLEASKRDFDRTMLMDKLEGWLEQIINPSRQNS